MPRYKSESNKSIAERIYPHRVDVTVPPGGLGGRLDGMLEWCRQRGCEWAQHGQRQHEPGQVPVDYARFYFARESDAVAFRQRWNDAEEAKP